jgi:sugar (glycoside-pentoside-hexuronide) transporter
VYQFKSLYYLFFMTNVVRLPVLTAGTILAIGTVWDAVNDPLFGYYAVNHKFRNGEKCRPWVIRCSIPWAITVVLLFTDFGFSRNIAAAVALIIYIVFEVFNTFAAIPYTSLAALATNRDADRRSINVFRNLGGCLGTGIGAVACLPLLRLFGALDARGNINQNTAPRGFVQVALIMGAVLIAGAVIHYATTKERVKPLAENDEKISVKAAAKMLLGCRSWVLNMCYIICYGVINILLMSSVAYYATYVLGSTAAATPVQASYLVCAIATSVCIPFIDKKLGRKKTMILGALAAIAGKIWFVADPFSMGAIYVNAATVGFSAAIAYVMFNTNRANIVDLIEWKDGRRLDGLVGTADNLASKLAEAGATQAIALSLAAAGFDGELAVQPETAIKTINFLIGWAPAAMTVVMLAVLFFMPIVKDMEKMNREKAGQVSPRSGSAGSA